MGDFVATVIKFNSQTAGRDKLCRAIQYASRLLYGILGAGGKWAEIVRKLKLLEGSLSGTRKVLRFGKSFDLLTAALRSFHLSDTVLRLSITLSRLAQALYLVIDHIVWMQKIGLMSDASKRYWANLSNRFWITTILFNLTRNFYDMLHVIRRIRRRIATQEAEKIAPSSPARRQRGISESSNRVVNGNGSGDEGMESGDWLRRKTAIELWCDSLKADAPIWLDTARNLLDIVLPLTNLRHISTSTSTQGLVGLLSSIIGIATIVNPLLKLTP